jgi:hypothetical protein
MRSYDWEIIRANKKLANEAKNAWLKKKRKKKPKIKKARKPFIKIITRTPGIWRIPDNF